MTARHRAWIVVAVALGGALGTVARYELARAQPVHGGRFPWATFGALGRYGVHELVQSRTASRFPYGTFVVNVSGSFVLGVLVGLVTYQGLDADVRTVVGTGFIGAYTTFSSFSYDTFGLFESGARRAALVNALGSVAVGLVAATAGFGLAGLA